MLRDESWSVMNFKDEPNVPAVLPLGTGELRGEVFVVVAQDVLRALLGWGFVIGHFAHFGEPLLMLLLERFADLPGKKLVQFRHLQRGASVAADGGGLAQWGRVCGCRRRGDARWTRSHQGRGAG